MDLPPSRSLALHVGVVVDHSVIRVNFCIIHCMLYLSKPNKSLDNICLALQYVLMISGEEITRLVRDYIKYLFGAKASVRLTRAMKKWRKFYRSVARKGVVRKDWLEREIVATPTLWHNPKWLAFVVRTCYERYGEERYGEESD